MTSPSNTPDGMLDELVSDFLDEASQLLDRLNEDLLVLDESIGASGEATRCDDALMNNMFRSAHSIKGLSAMLGLTNINRLTHRVENVFDAARKGELLLSRPIVQTIFDAVDKLSAMVDLLRSEGHDQHDAEAVIDAIQVVLQASGCERKATTQADAEKALETPDAPPQASAPPVVNVAPPPAPSAKPAVAAPTSDASLVDHFAGVVDDGGVPPKYLAIFIDEAEMSLDSITEALLGSDKQDMAAAIENLLITSHRIKGSAASVGLHRPAKLAHLMEDILQELREAKAPLTREMTDAMLQCADALRAYIGGLKSGAPVADDFNRLATELLLAHAGATHPATPKLPAAFATPVADPLTVLRGYATRHAAAAPVIVGMVKLIPGLALAGLKAQLIYEKLLHAGELLECAPPMAGVDNLATIDVLTFALATESTPGSIRSKVMVAGVSEAQAFDIGELLGTSEQPAKLTKSVESTATEASSTPSTSTKAKAAPPADNSKPNETLRVDIERLDQLMNLAGQLVINKARFSQIGERLKEANVKKQTLQNIANAANLSRKLATSAEEASSGKQSSPEVEGLRSQARRLATELDAIQRDLSRLSQLRGGVNDLFEAVHQLDRVADGIQKSVMDTRMVPIGPLFGRFKRVVRDITRLNNKDINLVVLGEKTELDKRMIDELGDPLIHMVRNAADHGIESPEARTAVGKAAQGTLTLNAYHRGNSIIIQVSDDGKGLDKDRILAKAIEKKIISPAEAEKMTPQQAYQLIWEPGFSTAEKVTEISGRGMGMDIVRSKIEAISGTVEVDSRPGQGTTFTIRLPLTLAILPSLMAKVDGDVFALPVESIVEIVSVASSALATVHGVKTASIRGRVVSVVDLNELFTWNFAGSESESRDGADTTLVVLGQEGKEIGLRVDALLGEEDVVIKSMAENYRNVPGIAGASILGNGRVSLILDVNALIEMSSRKPAHT